MGFMEYSPLWGNSAYEELIKLPCAGMWKRSGITHLKWVFQNGNFCSFEDLQSTFHLPSRMQFYYLQLRHADRTQATDWTLSPAPVYRYSHSVVDTKCFISDCYGMLLPSYLEGYPCNAKDKWEQDVGPLEDELWDNALDQ